MLKHYCRCSDGKKRKIHKKIEYVNEIPIGKKQTTAVNNFYLVLLAYVGKFRKGRIIQTHSCLWEPKNSVTKVKIITGPLQRDGVI